MSHLGQSRHFERAQATSAYHPLADISLRRGEMARGLTFVASAAAAALAAWRSSPPSSHDFARAIAADAMLPTSSEQYQAAALLRRLAIDVPQSGTVSVATVDRALAKFSVSERMASKAFLGRVGVLT